MRAHSTHPLLYTALGLLICGAPSSLDAQRSGTRSTASPPIPVVTHPAEGQVIDGDLEITVAVPAGSVVRRYATEAAYWDAGRGSWVYPGLLGAEFAGEAPTRIAADRRLRLNGAATRWRIRVHSMDPPGSWGPWREFSWQGTAGQASSSRATVASAPGAGANAPVANPVPPSVLQAQKAAALLAQLDKAIAYAEKQIVILNVKIHEENEKIDSLYADMLTTQGVLQKTLKEGMYPDSLKFFNTVVSLQKQIQNDENGIFVSQQTIDSYRSKIKAIEKQILDLKKERAALLANS